MADAQITRRIHIGGLLPSITPQHIRERFASFGAVEAVDELTPDAVGNPRPFTFFTIRTTPQQLRKCLNIMSGSTWRGAQLRLAEARPSFDARLEAERSPAPEAQAARTRKRVRRLEAEVGGKMAQDQRAVTAETSATKKADGDAARLVRPVALRPPRPLARPQATSSVTKSTATAKAKRPRAPPRRAHVRVLDPARWGARYATFSDDGEEAGAVTRDGGWEFVEAESNDGEEDEEDDGETVVVGRWVRGGEVEVVRAKRRRIDAAAAGDDGEISDDGDAGSGSGDGRAFRASRSASPLFPLRAAGESDAEPAAPRGGPDRPDSPLFPRRSAEPARAASPLSPTCSTSASADSDADEEADEEADSGASAAAASRASSPLFPVRQTEDVPGRRARGGPARPTMPAVPIVPDAPNALAVPAPLLAQARAEQSRGLGVLAQLLGDAGAGEPAGRKEKIVWDVYSEDGEESGEDVVGVPLRLRGGAGSDAAESDESEDEESGEDGSGSDEDESSDDGESDESDESDGGDSTDGASDSSTDPSDSSSDVPSPAAVATTPAPAAPPALAPPASIFAPSSFSLALLAPDLEIDDSVELPLPAAPAPAAAAAAQAEPLALARTSVFDASPDVPLFFPEPALALPPPPGAPARRPAPAVEPAPFWRHRTDADMAQRWEDRRGELTREWKRRHREAVKQRRRRGGDEAE